MPRVEVVLPKWGMTMQDATIVEWLRAAGERVEEGEPLARVETEKVEAEIESPASGVLTEIAVEAGRTVGVGTVVAVVEADA